jgi:alkanesulfonate monooxygenase SsuD/methylene tetrahydromethanopterin reductase-like flavin-dependent oxidoreductase (luciferase family)
MWLAVGSLPSFEKAGRHGLGTLGFGFIFSQPTDLRRYVDIYKEAIARAEPVGHYANDNFMFAQAMLCLEDPKDAREAFVNGGDPRLQALIHRYHDTFPRPDNFPAWPHVPPRMTMDQCELAIANGMAVGSPEEVIAALRNYEAAGVDQISFALPVGAPLDVSLEIIRVFGEKVLPHFDKDPIHRSTRHRYGDRAEQMVASALQQPG